MPDSMSNIAIVAAHPDDVEHGMGGTAWLLKDKYKLHIFLATTGQRGYPDPQKRKGFDKPPDEEFGKIRIGEQAEAAKMLGAEVNCLGLVDGEVFADRKAIENLAERFSELKPAAMFTHWTVDVPDHAATSVIATSAMKMAGLFHSSEIYFYETGLGGQTNQFIPDCYVNISEAIEYKRQLLRFHKTQFPTDEDFENLLIREKMRGLMARCEYAEPFKTPDPLVNARWGRKPRYLLLDL